MTRKWNTSITYLPKVEPVRSGKCRQTIRKIGRAGPKKEGDLISFHGWQGVPYRSPWSWRTPYAPIIVAEPIIIHSDVVEWPKTYDVRTGTAKWPWKSEVLNNVAALDGIVPPTGEALRDVLVSKNGKIPAEGIEAQIIRWSP